MEQPKATVWHWSGSIVDSADKPVPDVRLELYQWGTGGMLPGSDLELKQQTNSTASGTFDLLLAGGNAVLVARKPGFACTWAQQWRLSQDIRDLRLVLSAPTTVSGTVADDQGKPVAGAEVFVMQAYLVRPMEAAGISYSYMPPSLGRKLLSTKSGEDGRFEIPGFPANASADLGVVSSGRVLRQSPREFVSPDHMLCRSGDTDVKLVLDPAGGITGKVVAADSRQPIAGVQIAFVSSAPAAGATPSTPARSSDAGDFRLSDLAAGNYELSVRAGTNAVRDWVAERVSVAVESGKFTENVEILATRGGILEIELKGIEQRTGPMEAYVNVYAQKFQDSRSLGDNTIAAFRVPEGKLRVSASYGARRSEAVEVEMELGKTNRVQVELPEAPRISGVVRDPTGAPATNLPVSIFPEYRANIGQVKTDTGGHFSFEYDPRGYRSSQERVCLLVRDIERNLAVAVELEDGVTNLDLKLEQGLAVTGKVQDAAGKVLTNATAQFHMWSGNMGSSLDRNVIRTDSNGVFAVKALPAGRRYTTYATAPGYGSVNQEIAEDTEGPFLELPPYVLQLADHVLAGTVLDAEDKPAARASVHIYGTGQPNASTRTDQNGRFLFPAVCQGTIQVSATVDRAYGSARVQGGDTNVAVRLRPSGGSYARSEVRPKISLKGKPLPELAKLQLDAAAVPVGKSLLLCLFDLEQRPSRRFLKVIAEQYPTLSEKGLAVVGLQSAVLTSEAFAEWKDTNSVPFPVGRVVEKEEPMRWASEVETLPCLILTDKEHRVVEEYFPLEDLEAKLKSVK